MNTTAVGKREREKEGGRGEEGKRERGGEERQRETKKTEIAAEHQQQCQNNVILFNGMTHGQHVINRAQHS